MPGIRTGLQRATPNVEDARALRPPSMNSSHPEKDNLRVEANALSGRLAPASFEMVAMGSSTPRGVVQRRPEAAVQKQPVPRAMVASIWKYRRRTRCEVSSIRIGAWHVGISFADSGHCNNGPLATGLRFVTARRPVRRAPLPGRSRSQSAASLASIQR